MQVSILNALKSSSRIEAVFSFVETTAPPDHLPLCSYITIACRSVVAVCALASSAVSLTLARNCKAGLAFTPILYTKASEALEG